MSFRSSLVRKAVGVISALAISSVPCLANVGDIDIINNLLNTSFVDPNPVGNSSDLYFNCYKNDLIKLDDDNEKKLIDIGFKKQLIDSWCKWHSISNGNFALFKFSLGSSFRIDDFEKKGICLQYLNAANCCCLKTSKGNFGWPLYWAHSGIGIGDKVSSISDVKDFCNLNWMSIFEIMSEKKTIGIPSKSVPFNFDLSELFQFDPIVAVCIKGNEGQMYRLFTNFRTCVDMASGKEYNGSDFIVVDSKNNEVLYDVNLDSTDDCIKLKNVSEDELKVLVISLLKNSHLKIWKAVLEAYFGSEDAFDDFLASKIAY